MLESFERLQGPRSMHLGLGATYPNTVLTIKQSGSRISTRHETQQTLIVGSRIDYTQVFSFSLSFLILYSAQLLLFSVERVFCTEKNPLLYSAATFRNRCTLQPNISERSLVAVSVILPMTSPFLPISILLVYTQDKGQKGATQP